MPIIESDLISSNVFSEQDRNVLFKYGERLATLAHGSLKPTTHREVQFIYEIDPDNETQPNSLSAIVWLRYKAYIELYRDKESIKRALSKRIKSLENDLQEAKKPLEQEIETLKGHLKNCHSKLNKYEPPQPAEPRKCQCGGTNASCNYCQGSGWVK